MKVLLLLLAVAACKPTSKEIAARAFADKEAFCVEAHADSVLLCTKPRRDGHGNADRYVCFASGSGHMTFCIPAVDPLLIPTKAEADQ